MRDRMRVTFRGVRGSVPWAVPEGIVHGCNTPCLEVHDPSTGAVLILDAGSGIAGVQPSRLSPDAARVSLLLTHYHWDHLLGLPFFATLYDVRQKLTIHTPTLEAHDPSWLETIFRSPFFPVPYERLPNRPDVDMVSTGVVPVPGFAIAAVALNHPDGCLAYRIKGASGDFVYATDHEFGNPAFDEPLAAFAHGAAGIVLDAHFTPDERPHHQGWGHSDWRQCAEFAARNGIGRLWLFHHKPGRADRELEDIRDEARKIFPATDTAREEVSFEI
jgi:phosphoribosyl 1,2-cyclic phosphodiesterase